MRHFLFLVLLIFCLAPAPRAEAAVLRAKGPIADVTLPSAMADGHRWYFARIKQRDWHGHRWKARPWRPAVVVVMPKRVKRRYPVVFLARFRRDAPDPAPDPIDPPPAVTPLPAPLGFLLAGIGGFGWLRWRQSASATPSALNRARRAR
ncbi:MAG: hypothetical protein AAGA71_07020 [Pseudomonadota bacterium]